MLNGHPFDPDDKQEEDDASILNGGAVKEAFSGALIVVNIV